MTRVPYDSKIERIGSSAINAVYYDSQAMRLYIEFKKAGMNGALAGYSDVPAGVFEKFARAESVGKFYNRVFLSHNFEGWDMPEDPEMTDRDEIPAPEDWDWDDEGETSVYVVTAVLSVDAETAGEAIDKVLHEFSGRHDVRPVRATS